MWGVSNDGYNWSSTSVDSGNHYRSLYMGFGVAYLNPSTAHHRACGFPLRCLSE
ncbi:hypothetical protein [uncultured Rikenella sp.]|uniref:hypothetical protein n=1 Tax=uncultured Rikenella sp. TaxID=368003 RepID=UPI002639EF79|nr:hypothetical protein [uncultured Rikenella sp.]